MKYKVGYNDMLEPVEFDWESFKDESKKNRSPLQEQERSRGLL